MATQQQKLVIILIAVLLAVIIVSGLILWALPAREDAGLAEFAADETASPPISDQAESDTLNPPAAAPAATGEFNVAVFERAVFRALNLPLITNGSLPVKPPAAVGKANPFL